MQLFALSLWVSVLGSSPGWSHLARPSGSWVVTGWSQLASGVWSCWAVSQGASALLHVAFLAAQLRHVHMAAAFHDDGNRWGELRLGGTAKDLHPSLTSPRPPSGHKFLHSPQSKIHSPLQETPKSHAIRDGTLSKVQHLTIGLFFSVSAQCLVPKPALCVSGFWYDVPHFGVLISFNLLQRGKPQLKLVASHCSSCLIHESVGQPSGLGSAGRLSCWLCVG